MRAGCLIVITALAILIPPGAAGRTLGSTHAAGGYPSWSAGPQPGPSPPASGAPFWPWPPPRPAPKVECVAQELEPAAGLPGLWYATVGVTGIDAAGNVLFWAYVDGPGVTPENRMALFYAPPGAAQVLVREGQPAFDMAEGVIVSSLYSAAENISQDGEIVFQAQVSGPGITGGVNDKVLYVGTPGAFHKIRQSGDPAPDCPGYYQHAPTGNFSPHGTLLVNDYLGPDYQWRVVWIGPPDDLALAYVTGMQAPACAPGVVFSYISFIVHNDAGAIGFVGTLLGPGVTSSNNRGHWQGPPGAIEKISRSSESAPDMPEGVTYRTAAGGGVGLNAGGQTTEQSFIQGVGISSANDYVLYIGNGPALHVAAREGDPVLEVGPDVTVATTSRALISDRGDVLYDVRYAGTGITEANRASLWFGSFEARQQVMRDTEPAPAFPLGTTICALGGFTACAEMNSAGDFVGTTEIAGPNVTPDNDVVLWTRRQALQRWVPLLRTGDVLGAHVVFAEDAFDLSHGYGRSAGGDGQPRTLNDHGVLAMGLDFTDGTHGVYRISPPVFGDADGDGEVGIGDLRLMAHAWTGPGSGAGPEREVFDLDADGDVDLADQALLQQLLD